MRNEVSGDKAWNLRASMLSYAVLLVVALSPVVVLADAVTDYNLAVQFYKQERWKLAADACQEFVKKYPDHIQAPMAQLYWGQSLVHLRDFKNAREKFKVYLANPRAKTDRALAMYRIGESSYFLNDVQAAEKDLSAFLSTYPKHELTEWAIVYLAQSQFQLNKIDQAIQTFEAALTKYEKSPLKLEAQYGLARAYEADAQTERAILLYLKVYAVKDAPQAASALFHLAALKFSQSEYAEAAQRFQEFADKFPDNRLIPLAALNAGYANYQLKQFKKAIEFFHLASKAESQQQNSLYWIGLSHKSLGDYQAAIDIFKKALKTKELLPLSENIFFQSGDSQLRLKNYSAAITDFEAVYKNFPVGEYADDALHSACEAALQAGDLTKAAELNQTFEASFPKSGLNQVQELLYGRVLISIGDQSTAAAVEKNTFYAKAAEILNTVLETTTVDETKNFARFQLARAYERLNEEDKLIATLEPLLADNENLTQFSLDSLLLLANAKLRREKFDSAIEDYQRLLTKAESAEMKRSAYAGLISALIPSKDWKKIAASLTKLKEVDAQDKHFSQLSLAAGDASFEEEQWKPAEKFFQMGSKREVDNSYLLASLSGLGHTYYKQDQFAPATEIFKKVTQSTHADPQLVAHSFYMLGMSQRQAGNSDEAVAAYRAGLEKFNKDAKSKPPEFQETIYGLAKGAARTSRDAGQIPEAHLFYQQAFELAQLIPIRAKEELDKILFEWADMHYNAEAYEQADELFKKLVKLRPQSTLSDDARLILAEGLRFSGDTVKAESAFRALAQSDLSDDFIKQRAYIHLVDLGSENKKWQQVLSDAQTLQRDFPENEHKLYLDYRIAEAYLQTKQVQPAKELLGQLQKEILALEAEAPPWWEEVWLLQAQLSLQTKEYSELTATVEDLRERSPESKVIHRGDVLLGRGFENQAKFDEARTAYTRTIESESGKGTETAAEAQFRIAESYLKQNNFENALKEYYKVYAGYDSPGHESAALFQAARSDAKIKNWKGAVQTYRLLLDEFPESKYATDARKQLSDIEKAFPELKRESQ